MNEKNGAHSYKQFLDWEQNTPQTEAEEFRLDQREGPVYLPDAELHLVTEIAIVTGRPLLLTGEPGSGKSSFAPFVARNLDWRYYEYNVTGRTEAKDLLWRFDALRRLRDAQAATGKTLPDSDYYITPGVLWWAFDYEGAQAFYEGGKFTGGKNFPAQKSETDPLTEINRNRNGNGTVVLIDEIDKADPNVPNDLLEVIGMNSFKIDETGQIIKRKIPSPTINPVKPSDYGNLLIVITTNEERDLPPAFIRRCVVHQLKEPDEESQLIAKWRQIAALHAGENIRAHPEGEEIVKKLAERCWALRQQTVNEIRRSPSIAEFLDALRTCFRLKITPDSEVWNRVERSVLLKSYSQGLK